jgi:hypothetical protein
MPFANNDGGNAGRRCPLGMKVVSGRLSGWPETLFGCGFRRFRQIGHIAVAMRRK